MYLSSSNPNGKDIANEKNGDSKTEIILHNNPSDKRKDSEYVEEVTHNEPCDSLIVSDQVSIKIFLITSII